jgi:hypothetical protein
MGMDRRGRFGQAFVLVQCVFCARPRLRLPYKVSREHPASIHTVWKIIHDREQELAGGIHFAASKC